VFYREDEVLDYAEAKKYVDLFKNRDLPRLEKLDNYYKNKNVRINNRTFEDSTKPNNKISHSFSEYISLINTAMFIGKPVTYSSEDDLTEFNKILSDAHEADVNFKLAMNCSKYGYAVELNHLDKDAVYKIYVLDNKQVVLIFNNDLEKELQHAIRFWKTGDEESSITDWLEIYSKEDIRRYKNSQLAEVKPNIFNRIPINVYYNNDDLCGDAEKVLSLIDAYDLFQSDSVNENEYFNNAYLYLNTDEVEPEDIQKMKESRVLFGKDLNPEFVLKVSSDNESIKNRIVSDIHKLSFTPNIEDNNFANNVSGVAMKYKLIGTLMNIQTKQRKFRTGIENRNKFIFDYMYINFMDIPENVKPIFSDTLPTNTLEISQMLNNLRGLVSKTTLLEQIPFVENIDEELRKLSEEEEEIDLFGDDE